MPSFTERPDREHDLKCVSFSRGRDNDIAKDILSTSLSWFIPWLRILIFFFLLIYNQHEINWKNLDTDTSYSVDLEAFALVADHEKVRKTDIIYYNNFGCLLWCFMELVPNQQYCSPVCKQLKAACTEELGEWTRMSIKSFRLQLFLQTRMYYVR